MNTNQTKPNIVFIVAHPDDLAHSMGGTAYLMKEKYQLHVLCLTKGEHGIKGKSHDEAAAIREKEEAAACQILNANLSFLGQIDGQTYANKEICEKVSLLLGALQPQAVFTLWPINEHPDHVVVHGIATKALQLAGIYRQTELYFSENVMGAQTNQFSPDIYINISEVIEIKSELIKCHVSQNPIDKGVDNILQRNIFRGKLSGCLYAEAFKTNYPLTINGPRKTGGVLLNLQNG